MTQDSKIGPLRMALNPSLHRRYALTAVYLVLVAILFYEFSDTLWLAPAFAISLCALYFMPCVIAVALASYIVVSWLRFGHNMMSAVQSDYQFEPYYFPLAAVMFTVVAVPSAALPLILKAVLRLTKRNFFGRNYGWRRFRTDITLSLALSIVVISIIYVGTHREPEVTISRLYHQTANLSFDELSTRVSNSSLSPEERVAALIVISGMGMEVDQIEERVRVAHQFESELEETDEFGAFAVKYALMSLEGSEFEEEDFHFWIRLTLKESLFFSAYTACVRMRESGADVELAAQRTLASQRSFIDALPGATRSIC